MPKMKITIRGVEALKPPQSGQVDYWDTLLVISQLAEILNSLMASKFETSPPTRLVV